MSPPREQRFERLAPSELAAELARAPLVYVPLGALEWHGAHLPVGLDAFTAHGLCVRAAARTGGLVLPAVPYATGGGHGNYPWTLLVDAAPLRSLLDVTVDRIRRWGAKRAVLFSGHFPPEQRALMREVAETHFGSEFSVLDRCALDCPDLAGFQADHAGLFETSLLHALDPKLVHLDRLPPAPADEEPNPFGPQRHNPGHPMHGVFGPDPRRLDADRANALLETLVAWLVAEADRPHRPTRDSG